MLAQPDRTFILIDDDRVAEHNIATSVYYHHQVGAQKVYALGEMMYRKARVQETVTIPYTLDRKIAQLQETDLVIDAFDNVDARALTCDFNTVHVGLSEDRTGAVIWDEVYELPPKTFERGENPVCTHHLGARIARVTAMAAVCAIEDYFRNSARRSFLVLESMEIVG